MGIPLINGRSYSWASITVNMLGTTVRGITAISYDGKQEKTNNQGAGNYASSRGRGAKTFEASITLEMKEVEAIRKALPPGADLLDVNMFDIVVVFAEAGNKLVTHILKNAEFTSNGAVNTQPGQSTIDMVLPLIISHIEYK